MNARVIRHDMRGLNAIVKALHDRKVVRVGIMGGKSERGEGRGKKRVVDNSTTNAEIGFLHEFGSYSHKIPVRSWLRFPMFARNQFILGEAMKATKELLPKGNKTGILRRIGIACEAAIQMAFDTRGFGTWRANKDSTIKSKGSDAPLIDTAQLRRSVSSVVANPS